METYVIHVTKKCNADCVYCYEDDKVSTYTWNEVKHFIDKIIENRTSDTFGIEFLGGEPLLAWDNVRKSYEYLESFPDLDVNFYGITTNGTIMSEEIADYLSKNPKMFFAASLDGNKWSNQLRVFKESRVNTYDKVMENLEYLRGFGVEGSVHMVTHPYNVAFIAQSIRHLYKKGVKSIDPGIVESTIPIDEEFADRYIYELDLISKEIVDGKMPDLHIGVLSWLKPYEDIRSYIRDPETGKVIGETYGRSGDDITSSKEFIVSQSKGHDATSELIYKIRKTSYDNHQKRLRDSQSE